MRRCRALNPSACRRRQSLSLVPPLVSALQAHSALAHRLALSKQQLALAELLAEYRATFAPLVDAGGRPAAALDPLEAVGVWAECRRLLDRPEWSWGGSNNAAGPLNSLKADLSQRLRVVRDRIEEELGALFDGLVSASWDPTQRTGVVSVRRPATESGTTTSAQRLADALSELGTLEGRTQTLVGRLVGDLFRPAFAAAASLGVASFAKSTSADGSLALFHLVLAGKDGRPSPPATSAERTWQTGPDFLPALDSLLDFLSPALPPLPSSSSGSSTGTTIPPFKNLAALLVPKLIPLIVSDLLNPSLRTIVSEPAFLPAFAASAQAYANWERQATSGRSTELSGFASRVGPTWVRLRRADVLARARELVGGTVEGEERDDSWLERGKRNGWASWTWERETVVEPPSPIEVQEPTVAVDADTGVGSSSSVRPEAPSAVADDAGADDWAFDDPVDVAGPSWPRQTTSAPVIPSAKPTAEDDGVDDAWGFDDDDDEAPPVSTNLPALATDDDAAEPDAWGSSGSDDDAAKPIVLASRTQPPREAKRLGKTKAKLGGASSGDFGGSPPPAPPPATTASQSSSLSRIGAEQVDVDSSSGASRTGSPGPAARKGAMKLGKKALVAATLPSPDGEAEAALAVDERPLTPTGRPVIAAGPRTVVDRLQLSERVQPLFELCRAIDDDVKTLQNLRCVAIPSFQLEKCAIG